MIIDEQHRENLINIAKKIGFKGSRLAGQPTEPYLEYLSLMFNPEIAALIQPLKPFPETISITKFAKLVNKDKKVLMEKLEDVVQHSFLMKQGRGYALPTALSVHDVPFLLKALYDNPEVDIKKFASISRQFFEEGYYKPWETFEDGTPRFRVVTVSEKIAPEQQIIPLEEVNNIIDRNDSFAVIPCPCRKRAEVEGIRECKEKYPINNCIVMGFLAVGMLDNAKRTDDPIIRAAGKEEVKEITRKAAEMGLVHNTDNTTENILILCACCECCCSLLAGLVKFDNPRAIAKANYVSNIDEESCVACGTCIERCKFDAIIVDDVARINLDKCVGCGLYAVTCPEEAISMKRFEREEIPSITFGVL